MIKDGAALERLAEVDTVLFDKTGTLTLGKPRLVNARDIEPSALGTAAAIAARSRHPMSVAIAGAGQTGSQAFPEFDRISEHPGCGLEAQSEAGTYRLGRPDWALGGEAANSEERAFSVSLLVKDGAPLASFVFEEGNRFDAQETVGELQRQGLSVGILSGDRRPVVEGLASSLRIDSYMPELLPSGKVARIAELSKAGSTILMVGDGLNDAPALAAAHVSMAPATAADIGRNAADFVFLHESLSAVTDALDISLQAGTLIRQNFALAIGYNVIAVPIAVLGHVTPLVAAVAMSLSSIVVVTNALRLGSPGQLHRGQTASTHGNFQTMAAGT